MIYKSKARGDRHHSSITYQARDKKMACSSKTQSQDRDQGSDQSPPGGTFMRKVLAEIIDAYSCVGCGGQFFSLQLLSSHFEREHWSMLTMVHPESGERSLSEVNKLRLEQYLLESSAGRLSDLADAAAAASEAMHRKMVAVYTTINELEKGEKLKRDPFPGSIAHRLGLPPVRLRPLATRERRWDAKTGGLQEPWGYSPIRRPRKRLLSPAKVSCSKKVTLPRPARPRTKANDPRTPLATSTRLVMGKGVGSPVNPIVLSSGSSTETMSTISPRRPDYNGFNQYEATRNLAKRLAWRGQESSSSSSLSVPSPMGQSDPDQSQPAGDNHRGHPAGNNQD